MSVAEKGQISIHTENIFPIIKKFLYSDHEIFLRELVSNAVDATQKIKRLASLGDFKGELGDLTIEVAVNKKAGTLTVRDKGIGMTAEEIKKYINQIAFSGASEFLEKYKEAKDAQEIIGKFGMGFYSSFMVANKVEINTLSYQEGAEPAHWVCEGSTEFEISKAVKKQRGTEVILHINDDSKEFLEEDRVQQILEKYGKFLPVPVKFGQKEEQVEDGKDKDGKPKYKTVKKDNIINETEPLWVKPPSEIDDQAYLDFYRTLYPFAEEPLFWIHLNVDYPFNLTGILYFPKIRNDFEAHKNKIQLYSRQVFITDEVKDIVPEFLMLLHGVIDSPDIPLNVSRSYLQSDSNVKKINSHITKKVADKLQELFRKDREQFESKWDDISIFVKYGMIADEKFYDRANEFALLKNVAGNYFSLTEYHDKVREVQVDKQQQVVYLYASDPKKQDTYVQAVKAKGYDVLDMQGVLDNHWINTLEQKLEKVSFKRVDADRVDKLIDKDEKLESVLTDDEKDKVKEIYSELVDDKQYAVSVDSMSPDEMPVVITMPEFMRRMKDMSAMSGMGMGNLPDNFSLIVNGNHPLIGKIIRAKSKEKKQELARQSVDLALLSQGLLTGPNLTNFIKRSVDLAVN